ncbi:fimbrial tip adhesin FimD [Phocaeicola sp.]
MKTLIMNIAIMASLLIGMIACSDVDREIPAPVHKSGTVQLTLSGNKMMSRADIDPGVDNLNENKISNADLFFFAAGRTDRSYIYHTANLSIDAQTGVATVTVPADALDLDGKTKYDIYAIANASFTDQDLSGKTTLNQLKQLPATDLTELVQSSFVMDGILRDVALTEDENNGTIDLERAASKISLAITVADKVVVGEGDTRTVYTPILTMEDGKATAMTVAMYNRVKNGVVNGTVTPQYLGGESREISAENGHVPFYSYPADWNQNDENEAYLSLKIQWRNNRTGTILPYTYRVPVNDDTKKLVRNSHYKINLSVAILGSVDEETEVELEPEYVIENWSKEVIDTDMKKYQYLWVKDRKVVMNNVEEVEIEYASSSNLNFDKIKTSLTVMRYDDYGDQKKAEAPFNIEDHNVTIGLGKDGFIKITHPIDPITKNDYRTWYITLTLYNNDGLESDEIEIKQYPAIYAVGNYNAKGNENRFVYKKKDSGNVWDDRGAATDKNGNITDYSRYLGTVTTDVEGDTSKNRNMNQYKIYVTVLDNDDPSCVGDPRTVEVDNLNNLTGLTHYHPTKKTGADNMIAPSFLIASSWGITQPVSYEGALKRCATYQENGYPAGRWRVPTEAEIKFVQKLSNGGYIPALFDGKYWASSGNAITSAGYTGTSTYARCVYDLWFWGDDPMYKDDSKTEVITTFTWGDTAYTK